RALAEPSASGHDFHAATPSRVFGLPPADVTVELRSKIKAMNYGLAYGLSPYGLSQQLRITPDEARGLMEGYFEQFGGVRDYLYGVVDQARRGGYTETIMGRRRYLPPLTPDAPQRPEVARPAARHPPCPPAPTPTLAPRRAPTYPGPTYCGPRPTPAPTYSGPRPTRAPDHSGSLPTDFGRDSV